MAEVKDEIIGIEDLKRFTRECFLKIGVKPDDSQLMADTIVGADLIGHRSHGVFRLDKFIKDGHSGLLDVKAEPTIEVETAATALVCGHNGLGAVVGTFCMNLAKKKAKEAGAACVVANGSNNFGVTAMYSKLVFEEEHMMAFVVSNASPLVILNRAREATSGTNPISVAAPGFEGDNFVLDMSTSVTSGGNIEMKFRNGEDLPKGYALNAACLNETNAEVALKSTRFLPLGSFEGVGSAKGSNLTLLVDILCGVLAGAHFQEMVGIWLNRDAKHQANVGHCFIVINLEFFAPDFEIRLSDYLNQVRNAERKDPNKPVLVPGDRARAAKKEIEENNGIWYPKYVIESLYGLSKTLDVEMVKFVPKKQEVKQESSSDEEVEEIEVEAEPQSGEEEVEEEELSVENEQAIESKVDEEIVEDTEDTDA